MIILIPAYQPGEKLIELVQSIRDADPELAIVVVDDGSGPGYARIFDAARDLGCALLGYDTNRGKGAALKAGLGFVARRYPGQDVVCADGDGQHAITDILRVADRVRPARTALVLGTRRFTGAVPARSRFGNAMTRLLFRWSTGQRVDDTQTGLRGYPAGMLSWLQTVKGDRYEYELNILLEACRTGRQIDSVDIATIYLDENASSHFRPLADSARIYAPLLKFTLSSLAAFTIDTVALLALTVATGSLLVAVVGARILSAATNFLVNRTVVFEHGRQRPVGAAAAGYFALVVALLVVNYGALLALTAVNLPLLAAKLATEATLFVVSYAIQSRFLFAGRAGPAAGRVHHAAGPPTEDPSTARSLAA